MWKTKELQKRYGAKTQVFRQFWKPSAVRAALLSHKQLDDSLHETLTRERTVYTPPLTQVHLNREYNNRAVFRPEEGLDPVLDISLLGAELRALIQGKASKWQDNMTLQRNLSGEGNADKLTPSEAAQVLRPSSNMEPAVPCLRARERDKTYWESCFYTRFSNSPPVYVFF